MEIDLTIQNAIVFAAVKHRKQIRKGGDIPYIVHPMEVMQILTNMGCDRDVIVAGILHDVLEDTDATPEEIKELFGEKILFLVMTETEDKSKTWKERKQKTVDCIQSDSIESNLICLADKLANIRSIVNEKICNQEVNWKKFKAPKEEIFWYYSSIYSELKKKLPEYANKTMEEYKAAIDEAFKQ